MQTDDKAVISLPAIRCQAAARAAERAGVETMVPTELRVSRPRKGKPRLIKRAMVPGYLFADQTARRHLSEIREAAGRAAIIGSASSAGIAALSHVAPRRPKVGDVVEIERGHLCGMIAKITAVRGGAVSLSLAGATWTIPMRDVVDERRQIRA